MSPEPGRGLCHLNVRRELVQTPSVRTPGVFVIVSGLAASGKTAVAEPLANVLEVRLNSKDAIKEALFGAVGFGGWEFSKSLSGAADAAMVRIARDLDGAVLDNFSRYSGLSV